MWPDHNRDGRAMRCNVPMASILPTPEEIPALLPARGSIAWRAAGDLRLMAGAGYALLLQVSHPTVGAGVSEHSDFAADPWGRLLRTLDYVNGTIYGGPELAGEIGRRVRAIHTHIKGVRPDGVRYHALEPEAYAWVHATLAQSIVHSHRWLGSPMKRREEEEFWSQWRLLGRLVGVRDRDLPESWSDFHPYFQRMVAEVLEDTPAVHEVIDTLGRPATPPVGVGPNLWKLMRVPMGANAKLVTAGLLGGELRARFGLEWSRGHERRFRAVAAASRATGPFLLGPFREFGPTYLRWRRNALERGDVAAPRAVATA